MRRPHLTSIPLEPAYLDHHATTPVDPRVVDIMSLVMLRDFGNPASAEHAYGDRAAALVARARGEVGRLVGAPPEWVSFTSGASHAIDLAVAAAGRRRPGGVLRIALSRVEHRATLEAVEGEVRRGRARAVWIEVDGMARLREESLFAALADADLLCLMAANNEVGTLYPVADVSRAAAARGVGVLVDASQAAGRLAIDLCDWHVDYLVMTAHKLYGPKGIGALVSPVVGPSELADLPGGRGGTENVPGIVGFGEACRLRRLEMDADRSRIGALRDRLQALLQEGIPDLAVNGDPSARLAENLHVSVPGASSDGILAALRPRVAISSGAACSSGAQAPSHVLRAMGLDAARQEGALRIGLGRSTTLAEIESAAAAIVAAVREVRAEAAA